MEFRAYEVTRVGNDLQWHIRLYLVSRVFSRKNNTNIVFADERR